MRRALVSLPDEAWKVIDKELRGKLGNGDSEIIRSIVTFYLTEKGYYDPSKSKDVSKGIADELDIYDNMLVALVELLTEKGYIKQNDWETRIKRKISKERLREKDRDRLK